MTILQPRRQSNSQPNSRQKRGQRGRHGAAERAQAGAPPAPDLRRFTIDFFSLFGGSVVLLDRRKHGPLRVTLPPELAEHFGKPELALAFQSVEEGSGHELVAHGSRAFERMLAWLDRRSAHTLLRLPLRVGGSDALLQAIHPRNAGIANLRLTEQFASLYAFHWRITYRADDKREELYTVVLDEHGKRIQPEAGGDGNGAAQPFHALGLDALLDDAEALPAPPSGETAEEPPTASPAQAGTRLPPLTQLVRLAETARKYAVYHADLRCVAHEADILPRLYKALDRLTSYYGQQIEEVYEAHDPTGEKRAALELDLERKRAEEVENHRLRVHLELVGYVVLQAPVARADVILGDGKRSAALQVTLDRYTGVLQRPACHSCGRESADVALCRNGHVCCDDCIVQCDHCGDVLCASCGVLPCPACGHTNCETCGVVCRACGERACAGHTAICPVCQDRVCDACVEPCAQCGVRQCRNHLRADSVAAAAGRVELVCAACSLRCPHCRQYSARYGVCSISGQRFCTACLQTCADCGRVVGPDYAVTIHSHNGDGGGKVYCRECVRECPTCRAPMREQFACHACGAACCGTCARTCHVCGEHFCAAHARVAAGCGHVLCQEHAAVCAIGKEAVCTACSAPCAICDSHYCAHHQATCAWCGKVYCARCVHLSGGLCKTCASAFGGKNFVHIDEEPCYASPNVQALAGRYSWRRASNRAVTVYVGENGVTTVLIVVRHGQRGRDAVITRRLSAYEFSQGILSL
jgi:hypothetical protein